MQRWEQVSEDTSRLEVDGGHLYKVLDHQGSVHVAYAPNSDINQSLIDLAYELREIKELIEKTTCYLDGDKSAVRVIGVSDD